MSSQASVLTTPRRGDIDWLRVIATFLLILFQAVGAAYPGWQAGIGSEGFPSDVRSPLFFVSQWYIPMAFLLSGWSRKGSMQRQTAGGAVRERFWRLGVPFLTGVLVLCPFVRYLELGSPGGSVSEAADPYRPGSFPAFVLDFFTRPDVFTWYGLWFLVYLFVFALVSWPLFSWLLGKKVTPMKISTWWVYLPVVFLALLQVPGHGPHQPYSPAGWAGSATLLAYFILGFLISRYSAYERAMHREAGRAGVLGILMLGALMLFSAGLPPWASRAVSAAAGWLVMAGILGLGRRFLEKPSAALSYLRKASLPVFILYQAPLAVFGPEMLLSPVNKGVKLVILMTVTLGATMAFHHFLVRNNSLMRLLFGVKEEAEHHERWRDQVMRRDRG